MKNILQRIAMVVVGFLCAVASVVAAPLTEADLVQAAEPLTKHKAARAASIGVIHAGGMVTAHVGSLAPDNPARPNDRTLYEIGSITKVFTGLLLAEAVVRGEVTLDTPIAKLLPADVTLPEGAGDTITLRMLATHTSGLPRIPVEIPATNYRDPYSKYGDEELWTTLRRVKLDFAPGAKASYSNLGAGLLGTLLARKAGTTYPELLAARITEPLGMKDTTVALDEEQRSRLAPPFTLTGLPWTPWEFKALAGAGGIRSTLADMMRFAEAMLRPEKSPLQKAIELGWEKQPLAATLYPGGQGLGWLMARDGSTRWHNGMTGGFHAALFVNRQHGIASVLLSNRSDPAGTAVAENLIRRAAGTPDRNVPNRDRPEVALTAEQLDRCTGSFQLTPAFGLVFERQNQTLFITPTGQPMDRLYAASANTFFSRRVPAEIIFELPEDGGPATALTLKQNGREVRGVRQ